MITIKRIREVAEMFTLFTIVSMLGFYTLGFMIGSSYEILDVPKKSKRRWVILDKKRGKK